MQSKRPNPTERPRHSAGGVYICAGYANGAPARWQTTLGLFSRDMSTTRWMDRAAGRIGVVVSVRTFIAGARSPVSPVSPVPCIAFSLGVHGRVGTGNAGTDPITAATHSPQRTPLGPAAVVAAKVWWWYTLASLSGMRRASRMRMQGERKGSRWRSGANYSSFDPNKHACAEASGGLVA